MKKDVLVAIIIGFILGAAVALTATNLPQILDKFKVPIVKQTPSPTPLVTTIPESTQITLDSPADESIAEEKTLEISGQARANQAVVVETENEQKVLEADDSGKFSGKLNLVEGVNTIYVTSYDDEGNATTKTINVYYTSEKL